MSSQDVLKTISFGLLADWTITLSLIFGGCCSNALTLEQLTTGYPHSGSLITFAQFLLITLHGLPKFIVWKPFPHLKPRQISILPYLAQVILFYVLSSLNNAAFAYQIPMTVHIIFRSGGLVVSMLMGYLLLKKRYNRTQVASVLLITIGVILTTFSAAKPKSASSASAFSLKRYLTGICLLTLALILGGLLGVVQEKTYADYFRKLGQASLGDAKIGKIGKEAPTKPWQESMFYLHFLSMPMFLSVRKDLVSQFQALSASSALAFTLPSGLQLSSLSRLGQDKPSLRPSHVFSLPIPSAYVPLLLNTLTQLVCASGVNRLTTRVSNLTVTVVLVVRKAVSLMISVWLFGGQKRGEVMDERGRFLLWSGAACVFLGTIMYSLATRGAKKGYEKKKE